jgi:pimeloyl-ACP methyl ester carboxylesterase
MPAAAASDLPVPAEERRVLRAPGADVIYRIRRTQAPVPGAPIVFLHGLASNMSRWSELTRLTTLSQCHDLIRIDLRGHGESMTRRHFDTRRWREDLHLLLDSEGTDTAHLVGHSLGATVAMDFAAALPHRVAGLVLIDPVFREAVVPEKRQFVRGGPLFQTAAHLLRALNRLGLHRRRLPPLDLEQLDQQARAALADPDPARLEAFVRHYSSTREDLRHIPHANYLQDLVEMFRPLPCLSTVSAPVLVLRSTIAGFQIEDEVARRLAEFREVRVESVDCHHWPVTERPAEVRQLIENWISEVDRSARP